MMGLPPLSDMFVHDVVGVAIAIGVTIVSYIIMCLKPTPFC